MIPPSFLDVPNEQIWFTFLICLVVWLIARIIPPFSEVKDRVLKTIFGVVRSVPLVTKLINKEKDKALGKMREELKHSVPDDFEPKTVIPQEGIPPQALREYMKRLKSFEQELVDKTKTSGCIYTGNSEIEDVVGETVKAFLFDNPLHSDTFPIVRRMEAEVIQMVIHMLHGEKVEEPCGLMTTGGTESIFIAMLAYRNQAINNGMNPNELEILLDKAAHVGYYKSAHYLRMKIREFEMDKHMRASIQSLKKNINKNTVVVIGSAPGYPYGVMDPIEEMGAICAERNIGLHVDGCLGGFLLPFVEMNGIDVPLWDFRVKGVTSISCDTHKYGFAPKGTSVLLFCNKDLRRCSFYAAHDWPGGMYSTPSLPGSRAGGNIAGAWASMVCRGVNGYCSVAKEIYNTTREIIDGLKKMPNVELIGDPDNAIFLASFTTKSVDIYRVCSCIHEKGWELNTLQFPSAVHLCVTEQHIGLAQQFLTALSSAIEEVTKDKKKWSKKTPLYSLAVSIPDRSIIKDIVFDVIESYLDVY